MLFMKHWIATLLVRWINEKKARILESSVALRESTGLFMTEKIAIRKGSLIEDSEEAAYWIGMLMADGTIGQKHRNGLYPMVKLKLKADDWEHVASLTRYLGLPPERCRVKKTEALVRFNDAQVFDYLSSLGVSHRKTYTASISPEFEKK